MIDKEQIIERLTPEDVIDIVKDLGCSDYIERSNYIQFRTLCHHADPSEGSYKLYYYKNSKLFVCYTCCGTFDIFGLLCRHYETLGIEYNFYTDILLKLADRTNVSEVNSTISSFYDSYKEIGNRYSKNLIEISMPPLDPALLNPFINYAVPEWLEDGISEAAMRIYSIKYSINENKVVIPHYDYKGNLVGIRCRPLNSEDLTIGKYMPLSVEGHLYSHPLGYNLYGLNLVGGNIKRLGMAIVVEGEKSCLQYDTMFGHHDNITVATCGSSLHEYQIDLLIHAGARKILLAYDKEGTNYQEEIKYYQRLGNICNRYKNKVQMGYIRDTDNLLELKDSPTDKGRETFLKLYWKNVIWIK